MCLTMCLSTELWTSLIQTFIKHFHVPGAAHHTPTRQEADESINKWEWPYFAFCRECVCVCVCVCYPLRRQSLDSMSVHTHTCVACGFLLTACSVLVMCGSTCVFCVKIRQDSRAALSSGASGLRTFSNSSSVSSSSWLLIWQATRPFSCTAPLLSTYWRDCSTWGGVNKKNVKTL